MIRRVQYNGNIIEYELCRTARSSIECRIYPGGVKVFAPLGCPLREADAFVLRQAEWIEEGMERMRARAGQAIEKIGQAMKEGALFPVEGKEYALRIIRGGEKCVRTEGENLIVCGTDGEAMAVCEAVREFLIERARQRIGQRVRHYAPVIGVKPGKITLREQKTKWGSCSSLGNLNFNWKLIMAPAQALDYVVVHELCHLIEMNHSPAFWAQVERHCPDYRVWRDHLKNGIRSPFEAGGRI